jgi:hypothetical protein
VLAHKLREAVADETKARKVSGDVEIDGAYFGGYVKPANAYADEMAWREDNRRRNGEQYLAIADAALKHPVSRRWRGYWLR